MPIAAAQSNPPTPGATDGPDPVRRIDSRTLFGNRNLVLIEHGGTTYTLRRTRNGKLILTK